MKNSIPLSLPAVGIREAIAVGKAVKSGWLTQFGSEVTAMESQIQEYYSERFNDSLSVTTTSNGTTALHLALLSLGILKDDEIIIPNFCYIAVPNSILYCSARPVAVDINRESWNIDSSKIAAAVTSKTKAIILVDNYGRQNDISEIRRAIPENIAIIQDSAESFPGNLETEKSSCPDLITISCYANKILTAGEGGAVIGKPVYIDRIKGLKNQSQNPSTKFSHTEVGYNYRITNMQAAVFNTQWRKKNQLLKERAEIFKQYFSELSQSSINWTSNFTTNSTPWLFTISVQRNGLNIADVIDFLRSAGIESRPGFTTVSKTRFLADRARIHGSMEISENLSETVISLPTFPGLKQKQIKRIVQSLEEAISEDV